MKNKVLKLCKRLSKVTASEIAPILMLDEKEVSNILNELVNEDKLTVREDLIYFYKEVERKAPLPLFFEFHKAKEIELIMKCFCANVEVNKAVNLVDSQKNVINKFYKYFRECIYDAQFKKLLYHIDKLPYLPQEREYLGKKYYLYIYDKNLHVSEKYIFNKNAIKYSNQDRLQIKNLYLKASRKVLNNSYKQFYHLHISEEIFKANKSFDEIYLELQNLLV